MSYLEYVKQNDDSSLDRWDDLAAARPGVYRYWYREHPRLLTATRGTGDVT